MLLLSRVECEVMCMCWFAKCPPGISRGKCWLRKCVVVCVNCSEGCLFGYASEST